VTGPGPAKAAWIRTDTSFSFAHVLCEETSPKNAALSGPKPRGGHSPITPAMRHATTDVLLRRSVHNHPVTGLASTRTR